LGAGILWPLNRGGGMAPGVEEYPDGRPERTRALGAFLAMEAAVTFRPSPARAQALSRRAPRLTTTVAPRRGGLRGGDVRGRAPGTDVRVDTAGRVPRRRCARARAASRPRRARGAADTRTDERLKRRRW